MKYCMELLFRRSVSKLSKFREPVKRQLTDREKLLEEIGNVGRVLMIRNSYLFFRNS